jgi:methyl-accepting chemotaxis protein
MERSEIAAAGIREALEVVESVAAISEENAASSERVAATTVEVSAQAEEVNNAASVLTRIARELEGSTARFKIDRDGDETAVEPRTATGAPRPSAIGRVGRSGGDHRDVQAA